MGEDGYGTALLLLVDRSAVAAALCCLSICSVAEPVLCVWFAKDKGNYGFVEFGEWGMPGGSSSGAAMGQIFPLGGREFRGGLFGSGDAGPAKEGRR